MRFSLTTRRSLALILILNLAGSAWLLVDFWHPQPAQALVTTVSLTPTWNTIAQEQKDISSCVTQTEYSCEVGIGQTLYTYTENATSCDDASDSARIALGFDLSTIPTSAMITQVELGVTVKFITSATQVVRRATNDVPEQLNCGAGNTFSALSGGPSYGTFTTWGSQGAKTLDLGSQAISDIQQRLNTSQQIGLGIVSNSDEYGAIYSAEAANESFRPVLKITYSTTPGEPTNFILASRALNSLTWAWTENGWAETQNLVRDEAQAARCDAGPASGLGNPVSCIETGLQPNTLYTRHPAAVDPEGETNGTGASASTLIETPTGVNITNVTSSSISVTAAGTFTNLARTFSGLFFQSTPTGQASGWAQTNGWTMTGLTPNTPHVFYGRARNGDGIETSSAVSRRVFTLAPNASATSNRLVNTWYATASFTFTNTAGWGSGGVEYYQYAWNGSPTYSFSGTEPIWNPSPSLILNASHGVPMYLHLRPYNGDSVPSGPATYGPFLYDGSAPIPPASVQVSNQGNTIYTNNLTALTGSWTIGRDDVSGLREYQYALGTAPWDTDVLAFTSAGLQTSISLNGLNLKNGTQYYLSVRSVDIAGHVSVSTTSLPILANTAKPQVVDNQSGDAAHRPTPGTRYNIDFRKATTGPDLASAEYAVYTKAKITGQPTIAWTKIFDTSRATMTDNWSVNFSKLHEGLNYVSVRTTALDGLVTLLPDAFTIMKDTSPAPSIRGVNQATFSKHLPAAELLIVGKGFKPGAAVYVGNMRASRVALNKYGQLRAQVFISRLHIGRYSLRVVNPNGLSATRPNKVFIIAS